MAAPKRVTPSLNVPWLCFGDLNEITSPNEKFGAASRPYKQIVNFRETLDHCDLNDLGYAGDSFTWANNREGSHFTKERHDRALGNSTWIAKFEEHSVQHLSASSSDPRPILIQMQVMFETKKLERLFRYEVSWSKKDGCGDLIKQSCENSTRQFDTL